MTIINESGTKSTLLKIVSDRRFLYWLILVSLAVPIFYPLGLPISISPPTQKAYDTINSMEEGSTAIIFIASPIVVTELGSAHVTMLDHLLSKGVKVLMIGTWTESMLLLPFITENSWELANAQYGEDYATFSYLPGGEAAYGSLATDVHSTLSVDWKGNNVEDMTIMDDIHTAEDVDLMIFMETGTSSVSLVRHWVAPYGVPLMVVATSVVVPLLMPYEQSGQILTIMSSSRSNAEYELLVNRPWMAIQGLDQLTTSQLLVFIFIIIGNVIMINNKYLSKKGGT